jgi:hypothetical protein
VVWLQGRGVVAVERPDAGADWDWPGSLMVIPWGFLNIGC